MEERLKPGIVARLLSPFTELFGLSRWVAYFVLIFVAAVVLLAVFWFFYSAPPRSLTITAGAPSSGFETNAFRYKQLLAKKGVTLKILSSQGSFENLQRLTNRSVSVDIGFVQSGIVGTNVNQMHEEDTHGLVSLGSIYNQPLIIFYRNTNVVSLLSEFKGKRIAVGPVGSGTRALSLELLRLNGIEPGANTALLDLEAEDAAKAMAEGRVEAVFLMGDSASTSLLRRLLQASDVKIFDVGQADAYVRRLTYLNKLTFPKGVIDFGKNIPARDVSLVGPTVELVAREKLHPALVDLVIEAAQEVHGTPGIFRRKNEFPAALEHDFPLSAEAVRYYKSGKKFLYGFLPFWLASVVNRVLVAFVPAVVLLIPALRMVPTLLRLRVKLQLYRWYRRLLALERDLRLHVQGKEELSTRLDSIERGVNHMKVPASSADQFYALRTNIELVREHLEQSAREQRNPS
ncbi:MAG TPA: TAXI family TRAP transporter solute-binding subunit [Verrucomicrobiae bacterium]|jgi:TRAP-type uncharacterized transport system substrate-binding protein|nr:TAXI family TRAP transporter solute-binding subunit [Verrucomicrobiae bacterium]